MDTHQGNSAYASWWLIIVALTLVPMAMTIGFAWWMRRRGGVFEIKEIKDAAQCWDVFIKFIIAWTTVAAGVVVAAKFLDEKYTGDSAVRKHDVEAKQLDLQARRADVLQKKFDYDWEVQKRRTVLFDEAKNVVASLTMAADLKSNADRLRFEQLYSGGLIGIEKYHGDVEKAMVAFDNALSSWEKTGKKPAELRSLALELSSACQRELQEHRNDLQQAYATLKGVLDSRPTTQPSTE